MYSNTSFRDPAGFLIEDSGLLYRIVRPDFKNFIQKLVESDFLKKSINEKVVTETKIVDLPDNLSASHKDHLCMLHRKIEFVSYPWEWSFDQLKAAALLTLNLQLRALENDFSLKDATSLNIVFNGNEPTFVDVLSFEPYKEGKPWIAYGQFCRCFLFPLMITAYSAIDFNKYLCHQLGEISVEETWKMLGYKHLFKTGVFIQVYLQNFLQKKFSLYKTQTHYTPKIPKQILINSILSLRKSVNILKYPYKKTDKTWFAYANDNSYNNLEQKEKQSYIEEILCKKNDKNSTLIDFGANTGMYSRLAANYVKSVISVEKDPAALNISLCNSKQNITHFLCDITNPTPAIGFDLKERLSFKDRIKGDFFLALAIIHHMRITSGIPLEKIIDCFFHYAPVGIIEWVDQKDPMINQMLLNRENIFYDYTWDNFQQIIKNKYNFLEVRETSKSTRKLCLIGKTHVFI